jgi:tetratricopeptide (TPR) repeat protein
VRFAAVRGFIYLKALFPILAMKISRSALKPPALHIVCGAALVVLIAGVSVLIIRTFAHTLARNADTLEATEFAAGAAPNDPLTRYRYASYLERSFDLTAIPRSLAEYETAASLSPHNFVYWLALGQARERDGDRPAAETAYRRALELAPNYARTKWALGNNLVRQGKIDDGMELIRGAVEQDATFAPPAIVAAMLAFEGDSTRVSTIFGQSPVAAAELSKYLANEGRYDTALAAWSKVPGEIKTGAMREVGLAIRAKLWEAKRYRDAATVTASVESEESKRPKIGEISNGGFEGTITVQNADVFDWKLGETYPLFGLSDNQPKEGRYSLLMRFTTPSRLDLATVSRTVAVEPGATYELSLAYRAEVQTRAEFRWEVTTVDGTKRLVVSDPLANSTVWSDLALRFTVPSESDGVTLRLIRENCNSAVCTVSGNLWFDDLRLKRS